MNGVTQRGSSPLTRGKRLEAAVVLLVLRLIPAHAGKTRGACPCRGSVRAHPRSRGENFTSRSWALPSTGSSPLTRGKQRTNDHDHHRPGLIPAHAGKTPAAQSTSSLPPAHPRSRGENDFDDVASQRSSGSSPLTRGKPSPAPVPGTGGGLIPAHAGKTTKKADRSKIHRAHPRSRGENHTRLQPGAYAGGSSPLTRGKHRRNPGRFRSPGLIPAHAGKTPRVRPMRIPRPAHPRSRGENLTRPASPATFHGSSPLTRGKQSLTPNPGYSPGLIPAHAGKTARLVGQ